MRLEFLFEKAVKTTNLLVPQVVSTHAYGRDIQEHEQVIFLAKA